MTANGAPDAGHCAKADSLGTSAISLYRSGSTMKGGEYEWTWF